MAAAQGRMSSCPFEGAVPGDADEGEAGLRISFQGGRLDALCQLVVDGKLTLEEIIPYTGMVEQELEELFENWKWFSEEENEEEGDG